MDTRAQGESIMAELRGTEYIAQRAAQRNTFNDVLQDYAAEVCFGRVWSRAGLDRKQRSVITVAMLVALSRPAQLRNHLEGALNNGCTAAEIREILLHAAVYCGLPSASDAFGIAEQVLTSRGLVI
jgi:4-carboxymuconolactone decarboxylase